MAYADVEPFGYPMDNYRMGVPTSALMSAIYATVPIPKGKRRPRAPKPTDFYPGKEAREPELTAEQREHIRKKHGKRRNSNS